MADYVCPYCSSQTKVARTYKSESAIRRIRECYNHEEAHKFETVENAVTEDLLVRRSNGIIEPFNRKGALERSIKLSAAGTLGDTQASAVADKVMARIGARPLVPIDTARLGEVTLDVLQVTSITAALRYATIFLSSRRLVQTPGDLAQWISERVRAPQAVAHAQSRPVRVVKNPRPNHSGAWGEEFILEKLWYGIATSLTGLEWSAPEDWTIEDFIGALVAAIIEDVRGQPLVTSGQLSAASLRVLRAACPLAFIRYAVVAKKYSTRDAFMGDCEGLDQFPSPSIDLVPFLQPGRDLAKEIHVSQSDVGQE